MKIGLLAALIALGVLMAELGIGLLAFWLLSKLLGYAFSCKIAIAIMIILLIIKRR